MANQWGLIPLPLGQDFEPAASEQANQPADIFGGFIAGWTPSVSSVTGALSASETGSDTASISASVQVRGSFSVAEIGQDNALISSQAFLKGNFDLVEVGSDSASLSAKVTVRGSYSATEVGNDTAALTGKAFISGSLTSTETGLDSASFTATTATSIYGQLSATEVGSDSASFNAIVRESNVLAGYWENRWGQVHKKKEPELLEIEIDDFDEDIAAILLLAA